MYVWGKTFPFRKIKFNHWQFFYYAFIWTNQQTNNKREKKNPITIQIKTVTIIKYHFGKHEKDFIFYFFFFIQVICLSCVMYIYVVWVNNHQYSEWTKGFHLFIFFVLQISLNIRELNRNDLNCCELFHYGKKKRYNFNQKILLHFSLNFCHKIMILLKL